jgi:hypothetical protein
MMRISKENMIKPKSRVGIRYIIHPTFFTLLPI